MASTTAESDKIEIPAGRSVGGTELVITTTPMGFYRIESRGPGPQPKIAEQIFTSLAIAKRELDAYRRANAGAYAKEALKDKIVNSPTIKERRRLEREAAALALKNGEESTIEEE